MKDFLMKYRIILAVVLILIIIGIIWFLLVNPADKDSSADLVCMGEDCLVPPKLEDGAVRIVTKVIDGDTVLIEGGYSVRLLGIDADERGKPCYGAAKERLEEMVLGKEAVLEMGRDDLDQWSRYLRYVFVDDINIGLEMVKEGFAVARASGENSKYQSEIALAEKSAIENKVGCKWNGQWAAESELINRGGIYQWLKLTPELTGLKVVDACSAGEYYGQDVIVEGRIADGYRSKTNTVFLNFENAYPEQCFVGVIFNSDLYKFVQNPEEYYSNQMVRIRGKIKKYGGKPEIILKSAEQIEAGRGK
ncbi:MAG: thermonuclease family protein [Patescibacteria group bacterium]|nr:thermonuclease family protein [Patescibacteria group bacterium]